MPDILLVEDKDSLRRVLRLTLENAGYTVAEATDARAATNEISRAPHRLVLTDLRMPKGSACILSDTLTLEPQDLGRAANNAEPLGRPTSFDFSGTLSDVAHRALRFAESNKIRQVLEANQGNKSKTAEDLGISYKTLLTKIKEYDL